MTARRATSKKTVTTDPFDGAVEVSPEDLVPQELDPPDPALSRWVALAEWDGIVHHGGDASMMLPFPRPAWSDPDADRLWQSYASSCYGSQPVVVAVKSSPGNVIDDDRWAPGAALVSVRLYGTGITEVHLTLSNIHKGTRWRSQALGLSPAEALELADVLRAAVDLLGGADAVAANGDGRVQRALDAPW